MMTNNHENPSQVFLEGFIEVLISLNWPANLKNEDINKLADGNGIDNLFYKVLYRLINSSLDPEEIDKRLSHLLKEMDDNSFLTCFKNETLGYMNLLEYIIQRVPTNTELLRTILTKSTLQRDPSVLLHTFQNGVFENNFLSFLIFQEYQAKETTTRNQNTAPDKINLVFALLKDFPKDTLSQLFNKKDFFQHLGDVEINLNTKKILLKNAQEFKNSGWFKMFLKKQFPGSLGNFIYALLYNKSLSILLSKWKELQEPEDRKLCYNLFLKQSQLDFQDIYLNTQKHSPNKAQAAQIIIDSLESSLSPSNGISPIELNKIVNKYMPLLKKERVFQKLRDFLHFSLSDSTIHLSSPQLDPRRELGLEDSDEARMTDISEELQSYLNAPFEIEKERLLTRFFQVYTLSTNLFKEIRIDQIFTDKSISSQVEKDKAKQETLTSFRTEFENRFKQTIGIEFVILVEMKTKIKAAVKSPKEIQKLLVEIDTPQKLHIMLLIMLKETQSDFINLQNKLLSKDPIKADACKAISDNLKKQIDKLDTPLTSLEIPSMIKELQHNLEQNRAPLQEERKFKKFWEFLNLFLQFLGVKLKPKSEQKLNLLQKKLSFFKEKTQPTTPSNESAPNNKKKQ